jgi:hypothetical protein
LDTGLASNISPPSSPEEFVDTKQVALNTVPSHVKFAEAPGDPLLL